MIKQETLRDLPRTANEPPAQSIPEINEPNDFDSARILILHEKRTLKVLAILTAVPGESSFRSHLTPLKMERKAPDEPRRQTTIDRPIQGWF